MDSINKSSKVITPINLLTSSVGGVVWGVGFYLHRILEQNENYSTAIEAGGKQGVISFFSALTLLTAYDTARQKVPLLPVNLAGGLISGGLNYIAQNSTGGSVFEALAMGGSTSILLDFHEMGYDKKIKKHIQQILLEQKIIFQSKNILPKSNIFNG